jgi:hypothetical protein
MLASLEPKLFCSVALKERFLLMRTLIRRLATTGESSYATMNVKRLIIRIINPGNASAPQNQ